MIPQQPSLAESLASLRAATASEPAPFWLPASLHALIMACLARLFGRLEDIFLLWQAGTLPHPTSSPAGTTRPTCAPAPRPIPAFSNSWAPRARRARMESGAAISGQARADGSARAGAPPCPGASRRRTTRPANARRATIRLHARAPPPFRAPICHPGPSAGPPVHAHFITV